MSRVFTSLPEKDTVILLFIRFNVAFEALAQAFGYECCQQGLKTYFIKASELRDKLTNARKAGKTASCLNSLVCPSCLIIDEIGHCEFD